MAQLAPVFAENINVVITDFSDNQMQIVFQRSCVLFLVRGQQ